MLESLLVANTTREERERIVVQALSGGEVGCEDCVSEQDFALYQPYIDGEMELDEATRRFRASFIREDMDRPPRGVCRFVK
ncbi:MAG: purine biosynthesis protein PurH [Candidatus Ventricola sp.]|nr:purine biosynthesis protein PurH [Candidatus Ventricola sp.]